MPPLAVFQQVSIPRHQETAAAGWEPSPGLAMSLTHCPLCLALAVFSIGRGLAHLTLVWQLRWRQA